MLLLISILRNTYVIRVIFIYIYIISFEGVVAYQIRYSITALDLSECYTLTWENGWRTKLVCVCVCVGGWKDGGENFCLI